MKFKELVENVLVELTREHTPMNIISLINTIEECKDVKKVCIDKTCYDKIYNNYSIDIRLNDDDKDYYDYTIWYRYIDTSTTILITGIRDRNCNYYIYVFENAPKGHHHRFTKNEERYIEY